MNSGEVEAEKIKEKGEEITRTLPYRIDDGNYLWECAPNSSGYLREAVHSFEDLTENKDGVYKKILANFVAQGGDIKKNKEEIKKLVENGTVYDSEFRKAFELASTSGSRKSGLRIPFDPICEEEALVENIMCAKTYPDAIKKSADLKSDKVYETCILGDLSFSLQGQERLMIGEEVPSNMKTQDKLTLEKWFEDLESLDIEGWLEEAAKKSVEISSVDEDEIHRNPLPFYEDKFQDEDLNFIQELYKASEDFITNKDIEPIYEVLENTLIERNKYFTFQQSSGGSLKLGQWDGPQDMDFDDIIGYNSIKKKLKNIIDTIETESEKTEKWLDEENMILLAGPPGTGKTYSFRAFINNLPEKCKVMKIPKHLMGPGFDELKHISSKHPQYRYFPLIEDIDITTGKDRDQGPGTYVLLDHMESIEGNEDIITVLASTNRPDKIDKAILRPGRISTYISYTEPDRNERKDLIEHYEEKYDTEIPRKLRTKIKDYKGEDPITPDHIKAVIGEYSRLEEINGEEEISHDKIKEVFESAVNRQKQAKEDALGRAVRDNNPAYQ
jgi:hypothetical protein